MRNDCTRPAARAFAVLLLTILAGCRTAGIYSPDVQLQLAIQPAQVRAGDTLRLEFTVTNPKADTVALEFEEDCRVTLVILDASGRAGAAQRCMTPGGGRLALPAGGTWTATGTWRAATEDGAPIPAGAYVIRAVLGEHQSVWRGRREFKMSHATDTVAFRVLPRDAP